MLTEYEWVEAAGGRLIFYREDGSVLRAVAVRRLVCGCLNDGSSVCREHDRGDGVAEGRRVA